MQKSLSLGKIVGLGFLGLVVVLGIWVVSSYNTLVNLDENAKTAQADIEVQYQRRFDLIPNLVATVKGIQNQEIDVFTKLAEARANYAGTRAGTADRVAAINQTESALSRLLVITENYPQLKSQENFLTLQNQLEGTENRIAVARNTYNEVVNAFSKKLRSFPSNIIAGMFNFEEKPRFEVTVQEAKTAPVIDFQTK